MNQQAEALQSLRCMSKTTICTVTRSCPHLSQFHLGMDTIKLPQITVFDSYRRGRSVSACRFIADCNMLIEEFELSTSLALILVNTCMSEHAIMPYIWKSVTPDVTHVINFTRLSPYSRAYNVEKIGEPRDEALVSQFWPRQVCITV